MRLAAKRKQELAALSSSISTILVKVTEVSQAVSKPAGAFDYDGFCHNEIEKKKQDRSYRYFNNINRLAQSFPKAATGSGSEVTVWCSNDYLGMSRHKTVIDSMK